MDQREYSIQKKVIRMNYQNNQNFSNGENYGKCYSTLDLVLRNMLRRSRTYSSTCPNSSESNGRVVPLQRFSISSRVNNYK